MAGGKQEQQTTDGCHFCLNSPCKWQTVQSDRAFFTEHNIRMESHQQSKNWDTFCLNFFKSKVTKYLVNNTQPALYFSIWALGLLFGIISE